MPILGSPLAPLLPRLLALATAALVGTACVEATDDVHDPSDFEPTGADGKADGPLDQFNPSRVVSDAAFFDSSVMSADDVQRFFATTPYKGKRSFLADHRLADGSTVAQALVAAAQENGINPLVLLVTLQKEAGLVSRSVSPGGFRVNFAFGCGCPDGKNCDSSFRGLDKQIECAAGHLRQYDDAIALGMPTIGNVFPGDSYRTLDPRTIVPANRASALLYTYTPWVLTGRGGNWLFWNIWRKYARHLGYAAGMSFPFNEGYIGGECTRDADCFYAGARCARFASAPSGTCTQACTSTCPDRSGTGWATTFCVTGAGGTGECRAQCDSALSGSGCGPGQTCSTRTRHNNGQVERQVCEL